MDAKEFLAIKAKSNLALAKQTNEVKDEDGEVTLVKDPDAVVVTPQLYDKFGTKSAGPKIVYSIAGLTQDIANAEAQILDMKAMLTALKAAV